MEVLLSSSSPVPMYEQIKTQLRHAINGGELAEGALLPSLRQLAAQLRVSVITVTRAYNDLVAEGLVRNEHGRGFVVRPLDADRARDALAARVDAATEELVAAARAARVPLDDIRRKVEDAWNRQ
ncbi:GntR family transcriptional regulator [Amnibacterium sp.]|uniref:GntR family transcriptional regulator n=1 Tax=Amnibacterium sp. TaxID=1872496 RepID=UPI003F7BF0D9